MNHGIVPDGIHGSFVERNATYTALRVIVCGGRDYDDREHVYATLDAVTPTIGTIIQGDAPGADQLARDWARGNANLESYPADWKAHGRAAGPIRNQRMLTDGRPDLVIAFPGGRGTADMIRRARSAGVEVHEVTRLTSLSGAK